MLLLFTAFYAVILIEDDMDTETTIKEWLSEYGKVDKDNLFTYAKALTEKEDTSLAIFKVLEDRNKYADVSGN